MLIQFGTELRAYLYDVFVAKLDFWLVFGLVAQLFLQKGDAVALESPTYLGAIDIFTNAGAHLVPLPVGVSPGDTLNQPSLATHRYFYLVIAGLTIGFFLRVVRMKRSTNRNDRTERKYNEASTQ